MMKNCNTAVECATALKDKDARIAELTNELAQVRALYGETIDELRAELLKSSHLGMSALNVASQVNKRLEAENKAIQKNCELITEGSIRKIDSLEARIKLLRSRLMHIYECEEAMAENEDPSSYMFDVMEALATDDKMRGEK